MWISSSSSPPPPPPTPEPAPAGEDPGTNQKFHGCRIKIDRYSIINTIIIIIVNA